MKKADVNGENELPLYTWLKSQKGFGPNEKQCQFAYGMLAIAYNNLPQDIYELAYRRLFYKKMALNYVN